MRFEGGDGDGVDLVGFVEFDDLDGAHLFWEFLCTHLGGIAVLSGWFGLVWLGDGIACLS